jgi:hypothetical protein
VLMCHAVWSPVANAGMTHQCGMGCAASNSTFVPRPQVACGAPLSCLLVVGTVAVASSVDGRLHTWQYVSAAGQQSGEERTPQCVAGSADVSLQSVAVGESAMNALLLLPTKQQDAFAENSNRQLLAALEDGSMLAMDC